MYQLNPLLETIDNSNNVDKKRQKNINTASALTGYGVAALAPVAVSIPLQRAIKVNPFNNALKLNDTEKLPTELANLKTKNGETLNTYFKNKGLNFSRTANNAGPHFNPQTNTINLSVKDSFRKNWDKPLIAHELGHSTSLTKLGKNVSYGLSTNATKATVLLQLINCFRSDDESRQKLGKTLSLVGGTAAIPMIAEEIGASIRGTKLLNLKGKDKAKAFVGIGSYIAFALSPAIMYGVSEKTRQFLKNLKKIKEEDPVVNQKIEKLKKQDIKVRV